MAKTVKGTINDSVKGGSIEFGTFTLDPVTINAATQAETTVAFDGVASGDLVFVNPRSLTTGLHHTGARVTAADVVGVTLRNELTTNVDGASITYEYLVVKFGEAA
jgi:hypothetical protein